jgi:predicted branched-subunit amino acid permease
MGAGRHVGVHLRWRRAVRSGVVLAGGSPAAAVAAGLVLNARILPYGFTVADAVGRSWWARLLGAHLIVDETVAFTERHDQPQGRRAAFLISGVTLFVCWNAAVALGALAGAAMPDPGRFGLDAAYPTVLLALVLPSLSSRDTRHAALIGAVIAVAVAPFVPAGLPVLLALIGLVAARQPADTSAVSSCAELSHVPEES